MQLINDALLSNVAALFLFALSGLVTVTVPFTTIYASLKLHRSDLNIDVLILIYLLTS